jgi:type IV secretory pathway VirJ component
MKFKRNIFFVLSFIMLLDSAYCLNKRLPVVIRSGGDKSTPLIFHITGDGGMVRFDTKMSRQYLANGYSFIALNSLKYFETPKSPEKVAHDVIPVITHYLNTWEKEAMILVGFSFGAEITPFLYERLPDNLKEKVKLVVLLTPARTSDFHIHLRDMIGLDKKNETYNVAEETGKIRSSKILAIYGKKEKNIALKGNDQPNLKLLYIRGGHGFKDSSTVFELILKELNNEM